MLEEPTLSKSLDVSRIIFCTSSDLVYCPTQILQSCFHSNDDSSERFTMQLSGYSNHRGVHNSPLIAARMTQWTRNNLRQFFQTDDDGSNQAMSLFNINFNYINESCEDPCCARAQQQQQKNNQRIYLPRLNKSSKHFIVCYSCERHVLTAGDD